ncbi:hypothetical protein MTR67_020650 [Solanum verrucosum]|uniref:non-specific serine/threonine protein kinase n=1 Tax=Solanum verrucosum TaxID=315347 RepID=A0AAF0TV32_SOLVR|nr:hypothetical protein MTR67_020650 [Solanum verrucosum]
METFLLTLHILLCGFVCSVSSAKDIITATDFLTDGKTITSSDGSFEMGFFSPASFTNNWYVGIWYKYNVPDKSVVWVANRANPFTNTSGVMLKIIDTGQLALLTAANTIMWSTNSSWPLAMKNPVAQLLNSGNLVVRDANDTEPENFLWQSFDYPTDTLLPGMKMGKNFVTGQEFYLSSWKKESDPAPGEYTYRCDPTGYPQNVLRKGKVKVFNTGPWNGLRWSGVPGFIKNTISTFKLDFDEKEAFYSFTILGSVMSKLTIKSSGELQISMWVENRQEWQDILSSSVDTCDSYGTCGAYGSCNNTLTPSCSCLDTFVPKDPTNWAMTNWSSGCVRRKPLNCQNGDGFLKHSSIKLPDTQYSWFDVSMTLHECKQACLKNCLCQAYSNLDIRNGGSGCLLWYDDLIDIRELPGGQDIYLRVSTSELGSKKTKLLVLSLLLLIGVTVTGLTIGMYIWKKKKKRKMNLKDDLDLPLFTLSTLTKASSNFSVENKIGEGGFGSVYKGILEGGHEVAIKRLSKSSSQGVNEFKNEVICIAKLQHRNLVKLIDEKRSLLLNWPKRFDIINGIARGLLYLHQDSRLRIIHRDLKASNILLDADMNPKISDFGIARSVVGNETGANTHHVVGTHGYMSPEYVVHGVFSVKSDVFSFGVLVLEIISGRRNRGFAGESHSINLLGHVWKLYKEGRPLELIDGHLMDSSYISELLRLIHVALLCVQQCPEDRPDMATVILMLTNDANLPQAKEPDGKTITSSDGSCEMASFTNNWYVGIWYKHHVPYKSVVANRENPFNNTSGVMLKIIDTGRLALLTAAGSCEMASFTNNWYVGIWYKHHVPYKSVVANRENPFNNTSGVMLKIIDTGRLALLTAANTIVWSTNSSRPFAQLLNETQMILNLRSSCGKILLCCFVCSITSAKDIITTTDFLTDGKTITSSDGSFEMGFFSPVSFTNNWYIGIWYKHDVPDKSVVWVANRENPFNNTSGVMLKIIDTGQLALLTPANTIVWSTNSSRPLAVKNTVAQLLNSGNLVIRDANDTKPEKFLWQSFEYPTDTLLPGMKMGKNFVTGQEFYLSSWKNEYDPAPGEYTYHCDPTGYPQDVMRKGKVKVFSTGPWNGLRWSGVPGLTKNTIYTFKLDLDEKRAFYSFALLGSVMTKLTMNSNDVLQRSMWAENRQEWHVYISSPEDTCDNYGTCGSYGSCNNILTPVCNCLDKFVPKDPRNWAMTNWSGGCIRRKPLNCQNGDGFLKYSGIKLPDTQYSWFDRSMTLHECKQACLRNCSCMAYSNLDIRNGGSGCLLWCGDLIDIRELPGGQDIYIRVATSELGSKKTKLLALSLLLLIGVTVTGLTIGMYIWKKKKRKMNLKDDLDLPLFTLSTLTKASSNFSVENKIGEGGFGSVYKGILEGGHEVAIKRLSKSSSQGVNEFKNEVICIAKLQHRNLVKLIGCCIAGGEKMLVYEYMCNRSLDLFIFGLVTLS